MLTHLNYWTNCHDGVDLFKMPAGFRTLVVLPVDHSFAHTAGLYIAPRHRDVPLFRRLARRRHRHPPQHPDQSQGVEPHLHHDGSRLVGQLHEEDRVRCRGERRPDREDSSRQESPRVSLGTGTVGTDRPSRRERAPSSPTRSPNSSYSTRSGEWYSEIASSIASAAGPCSTSSSRNFLRLSECPCIRVTGLRKPRPSSPRTARSSTSSAHRVRFARPSSAASSRRTAARPPSARTLRS